MSDNELQDIAESIGTVTEEQEDENDGKVTNEEEEDWDPEDYRRDTEEYDGGWDSSH